MTEATVTVKKATLKQVTDFFRKEGQPLKEWTAEWKQLTDEDKEQILTGLGDGTLNY